MQITQKKPHTSQWMFPTPEPKTLFFSLLYFYFIDTSMYISIIHNVSLELITSAFQEKK